MTLLFAGGEDTSFNMIGSVAVDNVSFRAGIARCSLFMTGVTGDPPANRMQTPVFAATSMLWVHYRAQPQSASATLNSVGLIVRSPDGVGRIYIRQTATVGQLKISSKNAAGTLTDLVTATGATFTTGAVRSIDLKIDYTSVGGCQLWVDGSSVALFSGDPRTDSATTLNQVEFSGLQTGNVWHSEVIIRDDDTRGMALWTLAPQAAGNTQSWTPSTVGNINEITTSDTTFISTSTNNAFSEWTTLTTPPTGAWSLKEIVQEARVQRGATGPQTFDWIVRTGGADYAAGTTQAPSTTYSTFRNQIWATNPSTLGPWNISNVAAGFNLGIKSLT